MELREYLQELNKVQLLQPAEEQRLWLAFKQDEMRGRAGSSSRPISRWCSSRRCRLDIWITSWM